MLQELASCHLQEHRTSQNGLCNPAMAASVCASRSMPLDISKHSMDLVTRLLQQDPKPDAEYGAFSIMQSLSEFPLERHHGILLTGMMSVSMLQHAFSTHTY